ncbi:hypothetical protein SAMN04488556_3731 [Halostagnicola kamekurae]|uniref:Uncharacterized protein n=1 Tax=Halostagnicola kamekurae TaxID=619731 RepID=A0A1I6UBZ7_9EURY|nr:hypothetical protein SAMN04488556_3731 [Halostagnicola kamekurae]
MYVIGISTTRIELIFFVSTIVNRDIVDTDLGFK